MKIVYSILCIAFGLLLLLTKRQQFENLKKIRRRFNVKQRLGNEYSSIKSQVILSRISGILLVIFGTAMLLAFLK